MYKVFTGELELVMNNRIVYHKYMDGDAPYLSSDGSQEEYFPCVVADFNFNTEEYTLVPFKDVIGVSGQRRMYVTKEIYVR